MPDPNYGDLKAALVAAAPSGFPSIEALHSRGGQFALTFLRYFRKAGVTPRGVIQLGGHVGSDLAAWMLLGIERLLVVEPNPVEFEKLRDNAAFAGLVCATLDSLVGLPPTAYRSLKMAIGDRNATVELVVPRGGSEMGSVLGLRGGDSTETTHAVEMRRLDDVLTELGEGWTHADFNVLYMNIEGAELMALEGAPRTLDHIELVYLEANTVQNYPGNPTLEEIDAFLAKRGFVLGFRIAGGPPNTVYAVFWRPPGR